LVAKDTATGETVVYSGDTRIDIDHLLPKMEVAKTTFHEIQLEDEPDPVHTLLRDARGWTAAIRRKTWRYHFSDAWDRPEYAFVDDEFAGFAKPHQRYRLFG
jgi:ribonuclease BN (tRNA processing enzyme)